ncbi:Na+-translocating ferredoxin:NAD+ oxidoreductase RnfC subunit [Sporomusaceae bacterium BoRhaA]|uniref:SLBB domain-containing protein n=1 Tax=Pelorhabdus rhamnosifermentans TaxID=2772457 RepID=UPI001C060D88|nr:4Fe-4S dicluster domain-containing protein [Pelorhabdus rhamnosifermentans]MBU2701848.1 Na+-translocating ferredoxin:NAD+ oxidoreductase RnfC subunit [Pelorhabdus rhamnosifermentans]
MRDEIVAAVKAAGVVGAGGAGFPTHVKINATVHLVIANGAECEPLLRANDHLMITESKKLIVGLKAVMLATGAHEGMIALKKKHVEAIRCLQQTLDEMKDREVTLSFLPDIYPAGDEQVLVHEVTGKIVPEGGIPLQVGVVVANVETLFNVANALEGQPVTEKFVTVAGAVRTPLTVKVPLGMKVEELIALAGGATSYPFAVIDGGPMMGKLIDNDAAVTKTTGGILVLPADHTIVVNKNVSWEATLHRAKAVCCNCLGCTEACPRHLLGHHIAPHRIMQAIGRGQLSEVDVFSEAFLCSECGVCDTYGCTMGLSPRKVNGYLKKQFAKAGIKNSHHHKPEHVQANRSYRLVPTQRLIARLGILKYDVPAPLIIQNAVPREVCLTLSGHIGAPAKPIVAVGEQVAKGDLIATIPDGAAVGANVHASITGTIFKSDSCICIRAV